MFPEHSWNIKTLARTFIMIPKQYKYPLWLLRWTSEGHLDTFLSMGVNNMPVGYKDYKDLKKSTIIIIMLYISNSSVHFSSL